MKHIYLDNHLYFVTSVTYKREKLFEQTANCEVLLHNLKYYRDQLGFKLLAYAIMPDHFHAIIYVQERQAISTIMHDIKRFSSIQIGRKINRMGKPIWQQGYYEHVIRDAKDFEIKLDYIHKNPFNAGLVENLEDYPFSSYRNYYLDDNSIIEIDRILV